MKLKRLIKILKNLLNKTHSVSLYRKRLINFFSTMEIHEIKQQLTLATVLNYYNLKPDKNLRLNCPFHEDKTPSFQVYYKTHTAYCFSSKCKTHGKSLDVIDFIMFKDGVTKAEAINKAVILIGGVTNTLSIAYSKELEIIEKPSMSRVEILQNMFQYFKNAVHNSKPAQDYIRQRGLDATKIEIGYNTAQFHHGARRDEVLINNCVSVGLLSPWGVNSRNPSEQAYKPFAKYCICFALKDRGNHVTGLYFRNVQVPTLEKKLPANSPRHFYLKESTGLYPCYPAPETEKLIIAESIIDTASLLQIEVITKEYSLLACYGTNRLNDEMKTAIGELTQLKEIVFAFDNDEAGIIATEKYAKELKELLPHVVFSKLELPCKDVNETLQAHSEDIFLHLLDTKVFLFSSEETIENQEVVYSVEKETLLDDKELETLLKETSFHVAEHQNTLLSNNPHKLIYQTKCATYLIKGGVDKIMSKLNVTLEISNLQLNINIHKRRFKLDLYDNRQIEKVVQEAVEYLQLNKLTLEKDLFHLSELLDDYRESFIVESKEDEQKPQGYVLTANEKTEALQLASEPNLIEEIKNRLTQTGIVGEDENKTFLYIIAASHIQENPLNALIQGSSGSGKTNLLKGIYKTMPEESKKIYSRCSEKMLYNVPKYYFKNKLICFEDVDGLGEEAEYAWRELVSNGELVSGVSYKDEKGNIGIKELVVYGPITSIACTTKGAIYADNMSRLFLIAIDESKEQTHRINDYQAQEASGQINKSDQLKAIKQLQNYSRILQPYRVYNPFATKLKLPDNIQDERRLYKLYLHFIEIITVLHQYQRRKTNDQKLITTKQDCQLAKDLLFECIMLKMDELDGSLRQFFERLKDYVSKQNNNGYEFTQREIREVLQVKKTQLSYYINELISLEYLQQTSSHNTKGNRYRVLHFDNYRKTREEVKAFLQNQIDSLPNE
jgi:DNA primase